MRIHFTVSYTRGVTHCPAGHQMEMADADAIRLIKKGIAVPLSAMPMETAVQQPAETRKKPTRRAAKRKGR